VPGHGWGGEAVQVGGGELGQGLAEEIDGRQPSGAQDQGQVVGGGAGEVRELGGGLGGSGGGVVEGQWCACRHDCDAIPREALGSP